jgi:hypothetical protein
MGMAKIDEIKESLNTLRTALSLLSAFLIATGGALGTLFKSGDISVLFWMCVFFIMLCPQNLAVQGGDVRMLLTFFARKIYSKSVVKVLNLYQR